jgi:tRNA A-37 threonylcarbamoyl transferase component Bud32
MPSEGDLLGGRYRITGELGAGGMATVHRAHDERLERDVAVKVLLPNHARDPALAERFHREAHALAAAGHPGVVAVYDVDEGEPGRREPYFVMELCPGGSLAGLLAADRPIRPDDLVPMLLSVADGLASLHARGVVHRDVKPSNILLSPSRAKLADFGLARLEAGPDASDLTAAGTAVGTLSYLAPEVLAGAPATSASDIYALGVVAFVGLTGSMPRQAGSIAELVGASDSPVPAASAVAPQLGGAFDRVLAGALDRDPAKRPDAVAFGAGLTSALGEWARAGAGRTAMPLVRPPASADATTASLVVGSPTAAGLWPAAATATDVAIASINEPESPAVPVASDGRALEGGRRTGRGKVALVLIAIAALWAVAIAAIVLRPTGSGSVAGTNPPSPTPSAASASPSTVIEPTQEPSPTPVPTPGIVQRAQQALDEVGAAIEGARGSGGLKGKEANDLQRQVAAVRSALADGDVARARTAAAALEKKADSLGRQIDAAPERRLDDAIDELRSVLGTG